MASSGNYSYGRMQRIVKNWDDFYIYDLLSAFYDRPKKHTRLMRCLLEAGRDDIVKDELQFDYYHDDVARFGELYQMRYTFNFYIKKDTFKNSVVMWERAIMCGRHQNSRFIIRKLGVDRVRKILNSDRHQLRINVLLKKH